MNQEAIERRARLGAKLEELGINAKLIDKAAYIASALMPTAASWFVSYASAYSDGHNNRGLRGKRLDHYAHAYADMCEEVNLVIDFASFFTVWERDGVFEGTDTEHWHFA